MCERIVCIDELLVEIVHIRPPRFRTRVFVREELYNNLMDFLGGKDVNPDFRCGDIRYRWPRMVAIAAIVYQNRYRDDLYRIESSDPVVTAMKFMDRGRNDRLYCRELRIDIGKDVIVCEIHSKKSQKNRNKEKMIIERCGNYEFEVFT